MKKVGAWMMMISSVLVGLFGIVATLLGALSITKAISGESSAYGIGYATGQLVVAIVMLAIAWKLFTKGKRLSASARDTLKQS